MTTLTKTFAGSVFELPSELESEFDTLTKKMADSIENGMVNQNLAHCRLWVDFYLKFDAYYKGDVH